ncbi:MULTISPECIES: glutathione peroxidase [Ureibacillus]|jgi:glutathione peroxidase|uniref:Glutathione peroxidase n=1 Tax=Ureibacillus thermosphaericus TaxID=51173 RepID=A0A840PVS6_URETH|nr:glutathione peroxidase [Ureibacillus thermosphaericus]MBB5148822.1 glutathione peroxidase [Ureibacillus thermosphaericus]NKZ31600.1 glutathione peroxidase [Ureibacillus thermosphaericus]
MEFYDIEVTTAKGETYPLSRYKGQVMLIVNTASNCGFAPQFDELEKIYQKYKDRGFVVLGFPSNQFKQELDSAKDAEEACRINYGVTFPIHEIVAVNGEEAHPLFKFLTRNTKGVLGSKVKWNFTKFLVDRNGEVVARFAPMDKPSKFEKEIEKYL